MTPDESGGIGAVERAEFDRNVVLSGDTQLTEVSTEIRYTGRLVHEPEVCQSSEFCTYVFSIYNPSAKSVPREAGFFLDFNTRNQQDAMPG